jgi:hypothetical protein
VPPNRFAVIDLDGARKVVLNRKGLSVSEDWRDLPGHLIPEHLDDGFGPAARGKLVQTGPTPGRWRVRGVASSQHFLVIDFIEADRVNQILRMLPSPTMRKPPARTVRA